MVPYYVFQEGSNFKVLSNALNTTFYIYATGVGPATGTGVPGIVTSWNYTCVQDKTYNCSSGVYGSGTLNTLTFTWVAPADNGTPAVTGYIIRPRTVSWIGVTGNLNGLPAGAYSAWSGQEGSSPAGRTDIYDNASSNILSSQACNRYGYQIAAINSNGTGTFVPTGLECTKRGSGWMDCGCRNITVAYGNPQSTATYTYLSNEYCASGNYSTEVGYLWYYNAGSKGSVISSTSSAVRGTINYSNAGASTGNWLMFDLYEVLRANQCSGYISNCPEWPFYYNGTGYFTT